jgi:hypothetical protein
MGGCPQLPLVGHALDIVMGGCPQLLLDIDIKVPYLVGHALDIDINVTYH